MADRRIHDARSGPVQTIGPNPVGWQPDLVRWQRGTGTRIEQAAPPGSVDAQRDLTRIRNFDGNDSTVTADEQEQFRTRASAQGSGGRTPCQKTGTMAGDCHIAGGHLPAPAGQGAGGEEFGSMTR
ncbi:hypothetical protein [Streptomyces sp. NPDC059256]|uniref:hypothetical protein n=1 Tax=Streptomyces sp. NPDC059256 TaxID=3346794 RepID=UPI0036831EB6